MEKKLAIIGLGYVGLPLAVEFAKKYPTIGFDINQARVAEIRNGVDSTKEVDNRDLKSVVAASTQSNPGDTNELFCTSDPEHLSSANIFIITVPTPTDKNKRPVLTPLYKASETVGRALSHGDYVIYESTVYPGVTEDECIPVLEKVSNLSFNVDFYVGYSPERINPGDKNRTLTKIQKITSGSTPNAAQFIDDLYREIIVAGTHKAPSIRVAEAAKVIENSQRDINIAFVNELSKIFSLLDIDTQDVLEAARTKWNFLPFQPGLVGGHCIGVDPYYLAQKAQEHGYHPEIILAGRRINDDMADFVAQEVVKLMIRNDLNVKNSQALVLGFTFKENCPDVRNSKVIDVLKSLSDFGINLTVCDPWADAQEVMLEYGISIVDQIPRDKFDAIVACVAHSEFESLDVRNLCNTNGVVYDVKGFLPRNCVDGRL